MLDALKHIAWSCLAAALIVTPAAAQHYVACGCGGYHAPYGRVRVDAGFQAEGYTRQSPQYSQPSVVIERSTARATAPQRFSSQYYTPDEARALYNPVVVPLDEFLSPREPVALSPEQLARQRAAAEARAVQQRPAPRGLAPTNTPDADPFADDAAAPGETAGPSATTSGSPAETAKPAEAETTFADEDMPAEQPEADTPPEAAAPPTAEPADADPFESFE
jgi:hypothetical protein